MADRPDIRIDATAIERMTDLPMLYHKIATTEDEAGNQVAVGISTLYDALYCFIKPAGGGPQEMYCVDFRDVMRAFIAGAMEQRRVQS